MLNPISNLQSRHSRSLGSVFHEIAFTLFQLLLLTLLLLGIGGLAFNAISDDGWLMGTVKGAWKRDPVYTFLVICGVLVAGAWLKRICEERLEKINYVGDVLIYAWLVLGAYFGARLYLTGSL